MKIYLLHITALQLLAAVWSVYGQNNTTDPLASEEVLISRIKSAPKIHKIIGGSAIKNKQWPWLVSLRGQIPSGGWGWFVTSYTNYYCGGSLIHPRWVLTAAHCFKVPGAPRGISDPSYWHAKIGDVERSVSGFTENIKTFWSSLTGQQTTHYFYLHADRQFVHPGYDASSLWLNDIALLRLEKAVNVDGDYIQLAKLPVSTDVGEDWPSTGSECSMQGWGCTRDGGPLEEIAQAVTLPKMSDEKCAQAYGSLGPTRFCAGYFVQEMGICKGDSGGPLSCKNGEDWVQAGVASFAMAGGSGNWPGAYTRVEKYIDWINEIISNN